MMLTLMKMESKATLMSVPAQDDASLEPNTTSAVDAKKRLERLRDQRHQKQLREGDPQKQVTLWERVTQCLSVAAGFPWLEGHWVLAGRAGALRDTFWRLSAREPLLLNILVFHAVMALFSVCYPSFIL